jgi:hypothetical protein
VSLHPRISRPRRLARVYNPSEPAFVSRFITLLAPCDLLPAFFEALSLASTCLAELSPFLLQA